MTDTPNQTAARSYALFRGNEQISKAHSTVWAVRTEAMQRNLVTQAGGRQFWPEGYDIREAEDV